MRLWFHLCWRRMNSGKDMKKWNFSGSCFHSCTDPGISRCVFFTLFQIPSQPVWLGTFLSETKRISLWSVFSLSQPMWLEMCFCLSTSMVVDFTVLQCYSTKGCYGCRSLYQSLWPVTLLPGNQFFKQNHKHINQLLPLPSTTSQHLNVPPLQQPTIRNSANHKSPPRPNTTATIRVSANHQVPQRLLELQPISGSLARSQQPVSHHHPASYQAISSHWSTNTTRPSAPEMGSERLN